MQRQSPPRVADLISSKMQVPEPSRDLVLRSRLLDRLVGVEEPLVLVSGPAGCGKSALLEQWASADDRRFAWVSLDPPESDPVLFWRYLVAAIGAVEPSLVVDTAQALAGPSPDLVGSVVPRLLNSLSALEQPIVLVLDDYHRVDPVAVDGSLALFLRYVPRSVTVALASRTEPALPIADMHARGLVVALREQDLRMTWDESVAAIEQFNPSASSDTIRQIFAVTEGWATGVYLASRGMPHEPPARSVRRYLMTEMLDGLDNDDRAYLRKTSILGELEPALCDHVTGDDASAERLYRLANSNLLVIRLDDAGIRFRYHHLLQEVLKSELDSFEGPEATRLLHQKAYEWYDQRGDVSEAIHHAVGSGNIGAAAGLVCSHWYDFMMRGQVATAQRWISWLSERALRAYPPVLAAGASINGFAGNDAEARRLARLADAAEYEGDSLDGSASYESSVAIMHAALVLAGPANALENAEFAAELEPTASPYRPAIAAMIGTYRFMTGADGGYHSLLIEGAQAATGPPEIAVYALSNLALTHAWRRDWETAGRYANEAVGLLGDAHEQNLVMYGLAYAVSAQVALARGQVADAERMITIASRIEQQAPDSAPFDSLVLRTALAETLVDCGKYTDARRVVQRAVRNAGAMGDVGIIDSRLDVIVHRLNANQEGKFDGTGDSEAGLGSLLSTRERQVLSLLATELTLEEIGVQLYISRNTVKTHVGRTYRKLDVHGREQAIAVGRTLGYV